MARSEVAAGHRARVLVRLDEADRTRLLSGVFRPGGRSALFRFLDAVEDDADMFGAVIDALDVAPDGQLRAELWFWYDGAAIYATQGARFEVWYGHTVGDGVVLPWSDVGAEGGADAGVGE